MEEMLLIKDVTVLKVDRDPLELLAAHRPHELIPVDGGAVTVDTMSEFVYGRCFRRPDGTRVILGTSKLVQDVIGIQYEAWENMDEALRATRNELVVCQLKLHEIYNARFFKRLRILFSKG